MGITRTDNYFEDFQVGEVYSYPRGKTMTEMDNVLLTLISLNTAEAHYNEDKMSKQPRVGAFGGRRVVVGSCTIGHVIGLTAEHTSENSLAEISLDKLRLPHPVYHGDTLYAQAEVLGKEDTDVYPGAGIVHFKLVGKNQDGKVVFEGEKKTVIKKRSHYFDDDQRFGP